MPAAAVVGEAMVAWVLAEALLERYGGDSWPICSKWVAPMTASSANLVLTGFMGTGKTRSARAVAERWAVRFVDMDEVIVERAGQGIPEIFAQQGEAAFRALERALCPDLAQQSGLVIATGGGALVDDANRDAGAHRAGHLPGLRRGGDHAAHRRATPRPAHAVGR